MLNDTDWLPMDGYVKGNNVYQPFGHPLVAKLKEKNRFFLLHKRNLLQFDLEARMINFAHFFKLPPWSNLTRMYFLSAATAFATVKSHRRNLFIRENLANLGEKERIIVAKRGKEILID